MKAPALPGLSLILLLVMLALLVNMPARFVALLVEQACSGQCRISDSSGSAWNGQGRLFLNSNQRWFDLGPVHWRFPASDAYFVLGLGHGKIIWRTLHQLEVDGITLPAAAILGHPALQLPAGDWRGSLTVGTTQLRLAPGNTPGISGHGQIEWRQAATPLVADYPLGNYQINWRWEERSAPHGSFSGGRPSLILVEGQFDAGQANARIDLQGEARLRLERYLSLIARPLPDRDGSWTLLFRLD